MKIITVQIDPGDAEIVARNFLLNRKDWMCTGIDVARNKDVT